MRSRMMAAAPAGAAELKVIAAGAVRGVIGGMIDDYSRQTGLKFNFTVGPTGQLRDAIASGKPADLVIVSAPLMAETGEDRQDRARQPRRSRPRRPRRGGPRRRAVARHLDARGGEAGADQGQDDRLHRSEARRHVGRAPDEVRRERRHQGRGGPQGRDRDRRQRRRRQGRRGQGRHRRRADQRHPRQGRQARRPPARADPALDGLCRRDPGQQRRSRPPRAPSSRR